MEFGLFQEQGQLSSDSVRNSSSTEEEAHFLVLPASANSSELNPASNCTLVSSTPVIQNSSVAAFRRKPLEVQVPQTANMAASAVGVGAIQAASPPVPVTLQVPQDGSYLYQVSLAFFTSISMIPISGICLFFQILAHNSFQSRRIAVDAGGRSFHHFFFCFFILLTADNCCATWPLGGIVLY